MKVKIVPFFNPLRGRGVRTTPEPRRHIPPVYIYNLKVYPTTAQAKAEFIGSDIRRVTRINELIVGGRQLALTTSCDGVPDWMLQAALDLQVIPQDHWKDVQLHRVKGGRRCILLHGEALKRFNHVNELRKKLAPTHTQWQEQDEEGRWRSAAQRDDYDIACLIVYGKKIRSGGPKAASARASRTPCTPESPAPPSTMCSVHIPNTDELCLAHSHPQP